MMKITRYRGMDIVVLTRNEHCPPHAHVGTDKWGARFEFSFVHQRVRLLDVAPIQNVPSKTLLEEVRSTLGQSENLRRARAIWWTSVHLTCLENKRWDLTSAQLLVPKTRAGIQGYVIESARFDALLNRTMLRLRGFADIVEITL